MHTNNRAARLNQRIVRQMRAQESNVSAPIFQRAPVASVDALPVPGWNERRMKIGDFTAACEREGIVALRLPLPGARGVFTRTREGVPTIIVDERLRGAQRICTSFHELAHFFLAHERLLRLAPDDAARVRCEAEADLAAHIALGKRIGE